MPTHGLPSETDAHGPGTRILETGTVSVADDGTHDTGYDNVTQAFADANEKGPYNVNVYNTAGGELYFEVYNIGTSSAQNSTVSVDFSALVERR